MVHSAGKALPRGMPASIQEYRWLNFPENLRRHCPVVC